MKRFLIGALLLASLAAHAQDYDLSITMTGLDESINPTVTFAGTLSYANGALSNVNIANPTFWGTSFTSGSVDASIPQQPWVQLLSSQGGSNVETLSFSLTNAFGTGAESIDMNSIAFTIGSDPSAQCGGKAGFDNYIAPVCNAATLTVAAPELSADASLLTMLGFVVCGWGMRRRDAR